MRGVILEMVGKPRKLSDPRVEAKKRGLKMLHVLYGIATAEECPPATRVQAANSILDRGYGKPEAHVDISGTIDITAQFSDFLRSLDDDSDKSNGSNVIDVTPEPSAPMLQRSNNTDNDDDPDDDAN
tara:strand:- start:13005 stop:13385 length:381 start_codon:yes stop_codon:yes gene_type:complete